MRVLGKDYYRTSEGKLEELPPDITYEEAVKLEAEAKAGLKKIGKGPPPQPVPDVKKLAKKETPKDKARSAASRKKSRRRSGNAAAKAGAAASAMLKSIGPGKVAQYLAAKAAPVLAKGIGKLQKLRENEQTHDDAAEKRAQAEQAVVIPVSEGQSKSNAGQVNLVSARPAPTADENKAKQTLQESLRENVPRKVEDVDNFKRDAKAQHMGADVMKVVLADKNAVVATYEDMGQTPAPAPREHEPESLPPTETAPPTAGMNLGKDAIAPLQKEHTDVSNFTKEADSKLKEEGVTQEQLDMVDSGDLATAKKEKKGMETAAKTEPIAVQEFAQQEAGNVDKDLKQQENKQRQAMKSKRKDGLGATSQKQKNAKSDLEKKREEVAREINSIYQTAQDKVKKRLADLETESMKRFDDGNAKATKEFEDTVNREIDAFKDDRYSGWFGWARKARDWWKGMDDLPEVKAIFDRNRAKFVTAIDRLVADISADNKRVIQECKDELQNARTKIADFVAKLGPALIDVGKKAADEMNSKLNEMDKFVAGKEQDLQNQLKDKQAAAIKAIDEKIEKMKEAMAGALAKLGKLLLLAAKKFFTWALQKFGYSLGEIEGIISKGAAVLKAIFTKPIQFVKNLISAAKQGFSNFKENFLKHLKDAVFEWLTGSLQGVKLPDTWDAKGIASVIFQLVDISKESILKHVEKYVPAPIMKTLHTLVPIVQTLMDKGPMAVWEQLKDKAAEMVDGFVETVKDWIKLAIVKKAVETVLSMFIPGAGIVRAIVGIYDTIVFFIQKAKDIMKMIGSFLGSISEIAAGNIGAAAKALEDGLARGLKLVINFLARFLRLTGITNAIRQALTKIRTKVHGVLDKVAKWIADKAKALVGKGVSAVKAGVAKLRNWWANIREGFTDERGQAHSLYFDEKAGGATQVRLASNPEAVGTFLTRRRGELNTTPATTERARRLESITQAEATIQAINNLVNTRDANAAAPADTRPYEQRLIGLMATLRNQVKAVGYSGDPPVQPFTVAPAFSGTKAAGVRMQAYMHRASPVGEEAGRYRGTLQGALSMLRGWGVGNKWVKYHLVNADLGGRAVDSNLVPVHSDDNRHYYRGFESKIKIIAGVEGGGPPRPVWIEVKTQPAADPRFYRSISAEGGAMQSKQNRWDPVTKPPDFYRYSNTLQQPDRKVIAINSMRSMSQLERKEILPDTAVFGTTIDYLFEATRNPITSVANMVYLIQQHPEWTEKSKNERIDQVRRSAWSFER